MCGGIKVVSALLNLKQYFEGDQISPLYMKHRLYPSYWVIAMVCATSSSLHVGGSCCRAVGTTPSECGM